jgi:hypothetical protein
VEAVKTSNVDGAPAAGPGGEPETSGDDVPRDDSPDASGTCRPDSASRMSTLVECIADPVTPELADFASPSRSGSWPLTAAPPNSPSTSPPAPRIMSPNAFP